MSGLLISVRDAREAEVALAGGADLLDIKEPALGSLGSASPHVWRTVQAVCRGSRPTSVALGELDEVEDSTLDDALQDFDYAKIGLSGCRIRDDWAIRWKRQLDRLPSSVAPVAVIYADWQDCDAPDPASIIAHAAEFGCGVVLFDTHDKSGGDLLAYLPLARLQNLRDQILRYKLRFVLGGSLQPASIAQLSVLQPDYYAVRGAACRGVRTSAIDADRVRNLAELISNLSDPALRITRLPG